MHAFSNKALKISANRQELIKQRIKVSVSDPELSQRRNRKNEWQIRWRRREWDFTGMRAHFLPQNIPSTSEWISFGCKSSSSRSLLVNAAASSCKSRWHHSTISFCGLEFHPRPCLLLRKCSRLRGGINNTAFKIKWCLFKITTPRYELSKGSFWCDLLSFFPCFCIILLCKVLLIVIICK